MNLPPRGLGSPPAGMLRQRLQGSASSLTFVSPPLASGPTGQGAGHLGDRGRKSEESCAGKPGSE
jgi:hypothetical protein